MHSYMINLKHQDKWKRNKSLPLAESRIYKRCKASLVEVEEKYIKNLVM